jgi:hypothetical protein
MTCVKVNPSTIVCGSFNDDDFLTVYYNDRTYYFELHSYLGPIPVDKYGNGKRLGLSYPKRVWEIVGEIWSKKYKEINK